MRGPFYLEGYGVTGEHNDPTTPMLSTNSDDTEEAQAR